MAKRTKLYLTISALALLSLLAMPVSADIVNTSYTYNLGNGQSFSVQDNYNNFNLTFTITSGNMTGTGNLTETNQNGNFVLLSSNQCTLSMSTNSYPKPLTILINGVAYSSVITLFPNIACNVSWTFSVPSPSTSVNPIYPNSINTNWITQYLNNWDFFGFIVAVWAACLTLPGFYLVMALIISVAVYLQMKSLIVLMVIWIVIGTYLIVFVPIVAPVCYFLYAIAFGALLYRIFGQSKDV